MYFFISSSQPRELDMKYMNPHCAKECVNGIMDGKLQCTCGEDVGVFDWYWSKGSSSANARISNGNKEILFHPLYSSGTAAVRGDAHFQQNQHYFWEIKMISKLYGTDVMVGVGTSKIELSDWQFRFCSMLGIDSQSWGFSYHGSIQHNNLARKYGSQFGLGSIIGVHLDMCKGTLEYYVNRKPLGVAFTDLKGRELYPMVSSTAAQSAVRITCAVSEKPTLQMSCLEVISKHPKLYKRYKEIPGLTRLYENKYFWIVPTKEEDESQRLAQLEESLMCPLSYKNFLHRNKTFRTIQWIPPDAENLTDNDLAALQSEAEEDNARNEDRARLDDGCDCETPASTSAESRTKIPRTDYDSEECKKHRFDKDYCGKCTFRVQLEDEEMSDS